MQRLSLNFVIVECKDVKESLKHIYHYLLQGRKCEFEDRTETLSLMVGKEKKRKMKKKKKTLRIDYLAGFIQAVLSLEDNFSL